MRTVKSTKDCTVPIGVIIGNAIRSGMSTEPIGSVCETHLPGVPEVVVVLLVILLRHRKACACFRTLETNVRLVDILRTDGGIGSPEIINEIGTMDTETDIRPRAVVVVTIATETVNGTAIGNVTGIVTVSEIATGTGTAKGIAIEEIVLTKISEDILRVRVPAMVTGCLRPATIHRETVRTDMGPVWVEGTRPYLHHEHPVFRPSSYHPAVLVVVVEPSVPAVVALRRRPIT